MFRELISITLLVSLIAVGGSGLLMIILNSFEFQLQMHPVHKIFGIIMCISGVFHVYFNFTPIKNYLKISKIAISAIVPLIFLVLLFVAGMNKPLDKEIISEIEKKMSQLEQNK